MLDALLNHLKESGFKAQIHPETNEIPFPQIWMTLGPLVMQIRDTIHKTPVDEAPISGRDMHFINFFTTFPYKIEKESIQDAARLSSLINKVSPLNGYSLSEVDQAIIFHYTYPTVLFNPAEFDTLIHLMLHSTKLYAPLIKELAEKKASYEQLLAKE